MLHWDIMALFMFELWIRRMDRSIMHEYFIVYCSLEICIGRVG